MRSCKTNLTVFVHLTMSSEDIQTDELFLNVTTYHEAWNKRVGMMTIIVMIMIDENNNK